MTGKISINIKSLKRAFRVAAPLVLATTLVSDTPIVDPLMPGIHEWSPEGRSPFDALLKDAPDEPARIALVEKYKQNCATPTTVGKDLGGNRWNGFERLRNGRLLSRGIYNYAVTSGVSVCTVADLAFARSFDRRYNTVFVASGSSREQQTLDAVHGIMHAYLISSGKAVPDPQEGLSSRIQRQMTAEATANVAEFTVAAEVRRNGDSSLWQQLKMGVNRFDFGYYQQQLDNKYALHIGGEAPLTRAASATVNYKLRQTSFIDYYAEVTMKDYLREIGGRRGRPLAEKTLTTLQARDMGAIGTGINITGDVMPVPSDELRTIAKGTVQQIEALERLRARNHGYRLPPLTVNPNPYDGVSLTDLREQMRISGEKYSMRQAMIRAQRTDGYSYSERAGQNQNIFYYGFQSDFSEAQVPAPVRPLWMGVNSMRARSPLVGRELIAFSERTNVFICYGGDSSTVRAVWQPSTGTVAVANWQRKAKQPPVGSIAHEMLHNLQNHYGLMNFGNPTIFKRQKMLLNFEAAARAVSVIQAQEMENNGDSSGWEGYNGSVVQRTFKLAYNASIARGLPVKNALEQGGYVAFRSLLTGSDQPWLNSYNGDVLGSQINYISRKNIDVPDNVFDIALAKKSGRVSESFNFTAQLQDFPETPRLFGNNTRMYEAYKYVNLVHIERTEGKRSLSYRTVHGRLALERNPFLNVNIAAVYDEMRKPGNTRNAFDIMTCMAGLGGCPTPAIPGAQAQPPVAKPATPEKKYPGVCS